MAYQRKARESFVGGFGVADRSSGFLRPHHRRKLGQGNFLASDRLLVAALDFVVNFFPVHLHFGGGFDPNFDGFALDPNDRHLDATIDNDAFAGFTGEDEHGGKKGLGSGLIQREQMLNRIFGRVRKHDLFAGHGVAVNHNRAFEVHGRPSGGVQCDDVQQNCVVRFLDS